GCASTNLTAAACQENKDNQETLMDSDFSGDNKVSLVDYTIWKNIFTGGTPTTQPTAQPTTNPNAPDAALKITITGNNTKDGQIVLENSVMRAVFRAYPLDENDLSKGYNFAVLDWLDKKSGRNIAKQAAGGSAQ